ncbi:Guanosine-diphosphatase [Kluyveromyces marxianus]|nr:Guanosine-diphosphatase [Kluyveromyces marxianus]KAG0686107.1 Guanosine-diphosphatase [Kluyveromyces marxianus]
MHVNSIVRNYRFLIGALTALMLILLLRSSVSSSTGSLANSSRLETPDGVHVPNPSTPMEHQQQEYVPKAVSSQKAEDSTTTGKTKADSASKSGKCSEDHKYVVMIDAGSTGSRVHVYEFDVCTQPPTLINERFEMLKPGLSSFDTNAIGAAESLDPLLEVAMEAVPKSKRSCTPVAVKATAGLRLLGEEKSSNILKQVRKRLEEKYPFPVVEGNGVSIMNGEEEGVFAWVTANYLLGNIGAGSKLPTAAVFDLGGGSTQIVFEPNFPPNEKMVDGEHKYELQFGGHTYTLYQFSHLGYGLMQGRNRINSVLVETAIKDGKIEKGQTAKTHELISPCLPPGQVAKNEKVKLSSNEIYTVTFKGPSVPAGPQCRFLADKILNKDAECKTPPCSFNGVHQPSLVHTFKETNDLYVFSYFYDRTQPLGLPLSFTLQELQDLARTVCNGEDVWKSVFSGIEDSIDQLSKEPQWCLDLSFQVSLLHTGYDIPLHRELRTAKTIANNELGWCLGASLPLLESDNWTCRVSEVQ